MVIPVLIPQKDRCPYSVTKCAADEYFYFCELNGKYCLLESGQECDVYNDWLRNRDD